MTNTQKNELIEAIANYYYYGVSATNSFVEAEEVAEELVDEVYG